MSGYEVNDIERGVRGEEQRNRRVPHKSHTPLARRKEREGGRKRERERERSERGERDRERRDREKRERKREK
jgi:hypothetical protein